MSLRRASHTLTSRSSRASAPDRSADHEQRKWSFGLAGEPDGVVEWRDRGLAALVAGLIGLGVILTVAANWNSLGRLVQFALLQGLILAACVGAAAYHKLRAPLAFLALLSIGGLLAYFGQTYQTGADPWQLFALWGLLTVPLCLGARSDLLWAFWSLITMTAVALWTRAEVGQPWEATAADLPAQLKAWAVAALLTLALSAAPQITGAAVWAHRVSIGLAVAVVSLSALSSVIASVIAPGYWLGLALLGAAAFWLARRRRLDLFGLSAVALAIDILVVGGLTRWLLDGHVGDPIGRLLVVGLIATGLVALSVVLILRQARCRSPEADHG